MTNEIPQTTAPRMPRLGWLDVARAIALFTMATYHFVWDLEYFGYAEPGTAVSLPMRLYAHAIAGSFLFLAGASLYLAHGAGIIWPRFWTRLAKVTGAALLITVATWFAMPDQFIYFGILHNIAVASLLGLVFLRVPGIVSLLIAGLVIAAPFYLRDPFFNTPALYWVGLSQAVRPSNDYVPLLPWFGPFLAGIAVLKLLVRYQLTGWLTGTRAALHRSFQLLSTAGRHSLAIYLAHQPVLIGLLWCCTLIFPPASPDPALSYIHSCQKACVVQSGETFCEAFCSCTLGELQSRNLFDELESGRLDVNNDERVLDISRQCTMSAQGKEQQTHE